MSRKSSGSGSGYNAGLNPTVAPTATPAAEPTTEPTTEPTQNPGTGDDKPSLNTYDHYAYIIGYPEGDVRPEANISRSEVATIFFRLLADSDREKYWSISNDYTDVPEELWSNNAISTLTNAGILNGDNAESFRPDAAITRAEFAAIAARFDGGEYVGEDKFSDISGHWAASSINRAAERGWINGYEDGTFKPDKLITRAEAMTLINNVLERHVEISGLSPDMVRWSDNTDDKWYYTAVQEATNSHDYEKTDTTETWTGMRENRDWSLLESMTSKADSAGEGESIYQK
jgi:hypothetical protein